MSRIFLSLSGAGSWGLAAETWVVKYTTELLTMPSDVLRALAEHKVTKCINSKIETQKVEKNTCLIRQYKTWEKFQAQNRQVNGVRNEI